MKIFAAPRFRPGWILILIATLSSMGWTLLRWSYENSQVHVQLTVDYDDTRQLADAYQMQHKVVLRQLKRVGVSSVALYQQTLGTLRDNGRITISTREEAERQFPELPWARYVPAYRFLIMSRPSDEEWLATTVVDHLKEQGHGFLQPIVVKLPPLASQGAEAAPRTGIIIPASRQMISDAQLGFDPAQVKAVKEIPLGITARLTNTLNLDFKRVQQRIQEAKETGAKLVIFSEDEVLGYQSLIPMVSRELKKQNMAFGAIEFSKQRGLDDMMKRSDGLLVRVHSVSGEEAAKASQSVLVDRYVRAVKERNIRVAYIRLIKQFKGEWAIDEEGDGKKVEGLSTALEQNVALIAQISSECKAAPIPFATFLRPGLVTAGAHVFDNYPKSLLERRGLDGQKAALLIYLMRFFAGLGAVGAVLLLLNLVFELSAESRMGWMLLGVAMCMGLAWSDGKGAQLLALVAGCTIPTVALLWGGLPEAWDAWRRRGNFPPEVFADQVRSGPAFSLACDVVLRTSAITMAGGFITVALLNKWTYMSKAEEFLGEKATQLLPLILVGLAVGAKIFPHRVIKEGPAPARARAAKSFKAFLDSPFTVRHTLIGFTVLVAGFIWISRTGNDSGMDVSAFELKMRATLEQFLITRPRTKEIFLGFPALVLAVYFGMRRRWALFLGAALGAVIGQTDVYNTMCHIHTPLFYSLLRTFHALWIGLLLGGAAIVLIELIESGLRRASNRAKYKDSR